jgi:hypothetical protein
MIRIRIRDLFFLNWIRDGKIRIRDVLPASATLVPAEQYLAKNLPES